MKNKHNFFSQKKKKLSREKNTNKTKDLITKKDMDEAGRKKANIEKVGKFILLVY